MQGKSKYLALALFLALTCLVLWDFHFWSGRFPPNYFIEKLDVSGLSNTEVYNKLRTADVDSICSAPISLTLNGKVLVYKPSRLGIYISTRKTIQNLNSISYRSNYLVDIFKRVSGAYKNNVSFFSMEMDRDTFKAILERMASTTDVASKDATFTLFDDGRYSITKEKVGRHLDIKRSIANLEKALAENKRSAIIEVHESHPKTFSQPLVKYPPKYLLSEYTTYFGSHDSVNRVHNIKVEAVRLNNKVISSSETFSLLDNLGAFTEERGFREAFVIYNGELEPQYGGGSCQIATTLYNAALLAGMDIFERHCHDIYFTIYPLGRDASIYVGTRDLKIRNNTAHPMLIKALATDRKLTMKLYGTPYAKKIIFSRPMIFFDGEKFAPYNLSSDNAKAKVLKALSSGKPYSAYVTITKAEAGIQSEATVSSHYKFTGDAENVKITRPEPR